MLNGFSQQTAPLNDYEQNTLLPVIVSGLKTKIGAAKVIAGSTIIKCMKAAGYKLDGPRLRKIINHIRANGCVPCLVSTSAGYYVATSPEEVDDCISSIQGRIASQQAIVDALTKQRNQYFN
jgi:hypothetical protein